MPPTAIYIDSAEVRRSLVLFSWSWLIHSSALFVIIALSYNCPLKAAMAAVNAVSIGATIVSAVDCSDSGTLEMTAAENLSVADFSWTRLR